MYLRNNVSVKCKGKKMKCNFVTSSKTRQQIIRLEKFQRTRNLSHEHINTWVWLTECGGGSHGFSLWGEGEKKVQYIRAGRTLYSINHLRRGQFAVVNLRRAFQVFCDEIRRNTHISAINFRAAIEFVRADLMLACNFHCFPEITYYINSSIKLLSPYFIRHAVTCR